MRSNKTAPRRPVCARWRLGGRHFGTVWRRQPVILLLNVTPGRSVGRNLGVRASEVRRFTSALLRGKITACRTGGGGRHARQAPAPWGNRKQRTGARDGHKATVPGDDGTAPAGRPAR